MSSLNNTNRVNKDNNKVCINWLRGYCRYGTHCKFLHEDVNKSSDVQYDTKSNELSSQSIKTIDSTIDSKTDLKTDSTIDSAPVLSLSQDMKFDINTFGENVVKVNREKGLLFGPVLPEDFTKDYDVNTLSFSLKYLIKDLQLLLRLPFNHFLSHILYDTQLKMSINSFMCYMPRVFEKKYVSESIKDLYECIFKCIYRLFNDKQGIKNYISILKNSKITNETVNSDYYFKQLKSLYPLDIHFFVEMASIYGRDNNIPLSYIYIPVFSSHAYFDDYMDLKNSFISSITKITTEMKSNTCETDFLNYLSLLFDAVSSICEFIESYPDSIQVYTHSISQITEDDSDDNNNNNNRMTNNIFIVLRNLYSYIKHVKLHDTDALLDSILQLYMSLIIHICTKGIELEDLDIFNESVFYSWILKSYSSQLFVSLDKNCIQDSSFFSFLVHIKKSIPTQHYSQLLSMLNIDENKYIISVAPESDVSNIVISKTKSGKPLTKEEQEEISQVKSIFPDYTDDLIYDYILQYNHNIHKLIDDILNNKAILRHKSSRQKPMSLDPTTHNRTYRDVLREIFSNQELDELHNLRIGKKVETDYFNLDSTVPQGDHEDEPSCSVETKKYKQFQNRLVQKYEYGDDYDEEDYRNYIPMEENPNHKPKEETISSKTSIEDSKVSVSDNKNSKNPISPVTPLVSDDDTTVNDDLPDVEDVKSITTSKNNNSGKQHKLQRNINYMERMNATSGNSNTKNKSKTNNKEKKNKNIKENQNNNLTSSTQNTNINVNNNTSTSNESMNPSVISSTSNTKENNSSTNNNETNNNKNKRNKTHGFSHDNHNRKQNQMKKMSRGMI